MAAPAFWFAFCFALRPKRCADSATLGKTAGKDAAQDKPTYVTLKGLDYAQELAKELKGRALNSLSHFGPEADALRYLADLVVDRKK